MCAYHAFGVLHLRCEFFFFHYMIFLLSIIIIIIKPRVLNGFLSFSLLSPILVSLALWNRFWKRQRRVGWLQMYVGFFFFVFVVSLFCGEHSLNLFFCYQGSRLSIRRKQVIGWCCWRRRHFLYVHVMVCPPFFFFSFFLSFSPKKHTIHQPLSLSLSFLLCLLGALRL